MNDMEKRNFENAFKDAFSEAGVNPSENVWTNIELDLERAEAGKMKRTLFFYKILAAASVAFAMCVAGIGYYAVNNNAGLTLDNNHQLASELSEGEEPSATSPASQESTSQNEQGKATDHNASKGAIALNTQEDKNSLSSSADILTAPESANTQSNTTPVENSNIPDHNSAKQNLLTTPDNKTLSSSPSNPSTLRKSAGTQNGDAAQIVEDRNIQESANMPGQVNQAVGNNPAGEKRVAEQAALSASVTVAKNQGAKNTQRSSADLNSPVENSAGNTGAGDKAAADASQNEINKNSGTERTLPALYNAKNIALQFPKTEADPVALMFAKLEQRERELAGEGKKEKEKKKEDEDIKEKLWTSVGFAAGGFNPVNASITPTPTNAFSAPITGSSSNGSSSAADKELKTPGVVYTAGISLGTQLSKRWVLQGGVNYLTQLSDYTATEAFSSDFQTFKAASIDALRDASAAQLENKVVSTAPYTVNKSVQFMSVPLQAGYLVLNKKFGLQLNAGVSTDLFLQNTTDPQGGGLEKKTQGRGDNSPYRSVNFSGLVGTELSYKFSHRYRVALNPGLHYPFSSIYKSDSGLSATPLTFDVGLRFRYIFR